MSSVEARYEVSGERRKPKPSGSTSSVPSPKIETPFFAWLLSSAKIRSCLRRRLAFSMPWPTAISTSAVTWCVFSSERWAGTAIEDPPLFDGAGASAGAVERGASGGAVCDLLMCGKSAWTAALDYRLWFLNRNLELGLAAPPPCRLHQFNARGG